MANNMMKGFGRDIGAVFDRDPFANDPFFKEPFGNIDKVIGEMRNNMMRQMSEPMDSGMGAGKG